MPSSAKDTALQACHFVFNNDYGALSKLLSRTPAAWKSEVFYEVLKVPTLSRACLDVLFRHGLTTSTLLGEHSVPPLKFLAGAGSLELARYLVEQRKADLEGKDKNGRTALMEASLAGHTDVVRYLLDRGADIHAADCDGHQAIHSATEKGATDTLALLLDRGADINTVGRHGNTPLYIAAHFGRMNAVRLLLDRGASEGPWPSIIGAAAKGHIAIIELLLSRGRDINAMSPNGRNALDWAIAEGHTETVAFLLDRGATFRTHHGEESVPVHDAVFDGHTSVLRLLLERRLPVLSIRNDMGNTCLHRASVGVNIETLRFLLDRGMEVDVRAYNGSTPLHYAVLRGAVECVRLLLERGASLEVYGRVWEDGRTAVPPLLAAAVSCRNPLAGVDPALHLAMFELLLDHIDRSEDPGRLLMMPGSNGMTVQSHVPADSPAFALFANRLNHSIPALEFYYYPEMLHGGFHPPPFDFGSLTVGLIMLSLRKTVSLSPSEWSSGVLRLLDLFPSDLRPFESEPDAVYVGALAFKVKDLRRQLHSLLPSQCGRDWTGNRLAWFEAGRVVQRCMEAVLRRATGHVS